MKKLLSLLLIICSIGVAYADDKSTVTSLKYVTDELNTRQDKFGANDGKAMTFTNAAGGNLPRDVKESLGTSTTDSGLPTVSAVNAGLDDKQNTIPAVNTNTVVTYTGTPGTLGQKGIYQDTGTYASQQDNLIDAGTFNAALRNGLENEFVCAGTDDGTANGNCWLWTIHNEENVGKNLLNPNNIHQGTIVTATGHVAYAPNRCYFDYIPVRAGDKIWLSVKNNTPPPYNIYFYTEQNEDSYEGVLSTTSFSFGDYSGKKTTAAKDGYIRAIFLQSENFTTADVIDAQFVIQNSAPTEYEPYIGEMVYIPQNQTAQNP